MRCAEKGPSQKLGHFSSSNNNMQTSALPNRKKTKNGKTEAFTDGASVWILPLRASMHPVDHYRFFLPKKAT